MSDGFPIQGCGTIPLPAAEKAYETYRAFYGGSQSLARLGERGGFGLNEWACLYLGHIPTGHYRAQDCIWKALAHAGLLSVPRAPADRATANRQEG